MIREIKAKRSTCKEQTKSQTHKLGLEVKDPNHM